MSDKTETIRKRYSPLDVNSHEVKKKYSHFITTEKPSGLVAEPLWIQSKI